MTSLQGRYDSFLEQQGCCSRKGCNSLNRWAATVKLQPQARPCPLQTCLESFPDCLLFSLKWNTLVISGSRFPLDLWLSQLQNLSHGPILMCAKSCTLIWPVSAPSNSRQTCPHLMPLSSEPLLFSKGPRTFMMWWRGVQTIWTDPMMVRQQLCPRNVRNVVHVFFVDYGAVWGHICKVAGVGSKRERCVFLFCRVCTRGSVYPQQQPCRWLPHLSSDHEGLCGTAIQWTTR